MATWIPGVDASYSRLTDEIAHDLWDAGYRVFAQCLWTGSETPAVAQENLRVAIHRAFIPVGYISVTGSMGGAWHVDRGHAAVDEETWQALALAPVDVELWGIPNTTIRQAVERTVELGKRRCTYTNFQSWAEKQGNPQDFTDCLLWNALWDGCEDFDFPNLPYGGWSPSQVVGEQYTGGHDVLGLNADKDIWAKELLIKERIMPDGKSSVGRFAAIQDGARRGKLTPGPARTLIALAIANLLNPLLLRLGDGTDIWEILPTPQLTEQQERDLQAAVIRMARNAEYQDLVNALKACKGIEATV